MNKEREEHTQLVISGDGDGLSDRRQEHEVEKRINTARREILLVVPVAELAHEGAQTSSVGIGRNVAWNVLGWHVRQGAQSRDMRHGKQSTEVTKLNLSEVLRRVAIV